MNEISSGIAFWIFDAWRRMSAQVQVETTKGIKSGGSPGAIWRTSPNPFKISVVMLDTQGQKNEWVVPLEGCKFSFGVPLESAPFPEYAEGIWLSYLVVDFPDGAQTVFAERFIDSELG
jgi:hypothetical protein